MPTETREPREGWRVDTALPRADTAHPARSPRNYWRGPVWANVTWLTALGLRLHGEERAAMALREQMIGAIEGGGIREYFVPESGRGLGARDFAWTAALCLRELRPT
jgi:glycogen debranching enzyme